MNTNIYSHPIFVGLAITTLVFAMVKYVKHGTASKGSGSVARMTATLIFLILTYITIAYAYDFWSFLKTTPFSPKNYLTGMLPAYILAYFFGTQTAISFATWIKGGDLKTAAQNENSLTIEGIFKGVYFYNWIATGFLSVVIITIVCLYMKFAVIYLFWSECIIYAIIYATPMTMFSGLFVGAICGWEGEFPPELGKKSFDFKTHYIKTCRAYKCMGIIATLGISIFYYIAPTAIDKKSVMITAGILIIVGGLIYASHRLQKYHEIEKR